MGPPANDDWGTAVTTGFVVAAEAGVVGLEFEVPVVTEADRGDTGVLLTIGSALATAGLVGAEAGWIVLLAGRAEAIVVATAATDAAVTGAVEFEVDPLFVVVAATGAGSRGGRP